MSFGEKVIQVGMYCFSKHSTLTATETPSLLKLVRKVRLAIQVDSTLAERVRAGSNQSYTVQLLNDSNLRLKKLGEETAELVAALATGHQEGAVEEAADLVYHLLVALRADGSSLAALLNELSSRFKATSRAESSSD